LQCDNGDGTDPYNLFKDQPYDQIVERASEVPQDTMHMSPAAPFFDSNDSDDDFGDGVASDVLGFDDGDSSTDPQTSTPTEPANEGGA
jgi:hypothetical protein